jgi:DNA-binding response OmpR family regulator
MLSVSNVSRRAGTLMAVDSFPQMTPSILIIDDYTEHLKIYGWLVEQAGYAPVPCLAGPNGPELHSDRPVDLVLLDYTLGCDTPTCDVARLIQQMWPGAPILLLSDVHGLPVEMEPLVADFVPKGQPAKLVATIRTLLSARDNPSREGRSS